MTQPVPKSKDRNQSDDFKSSSVPLEGGGDTHFHQHSDKEGGDAVTVTTRLPGGVTEHDTISDSDITREAQTDAASKADTDEPSESPADE